MSNADQTGATNGARTPDEIRAEIDATRTGLGYDVDALADKVNPTQIAHRQADRVKSRFSNVRDSVMGAAHSHTDSATGSVSRAGSNAQDAGRQAVEKAKGNPLAVGLVAFGIGWLVSSLVPATEKEQDLAGQVKEKAAPLVDQAKGAAQDLAQNLKDPAQDALAQVKETAQDAASTVKDEAQGAASDVKDSAQESKDTVQGA